MYPEWNADQEISLNGEQGGVRSLNFESSEDKALGVRFLSEPQQNEAKTKEAGRPIFDDVEICEIRLPGSTDLVREVVSDAHRNRFRRQYAAFRQGNDQDSASGTPLAAWPLMTRAQVEEAKYFGVRTVEALAQTPDSGMQKLGAGWLAFRTKARDWLEAAQKGAVAAKLRDELLERDRRISALEQMMVKQAQEIAAARGGGVLPAAESAPDATVVKLMAQVEALTQAIAAKPEPKKRGRPAKTATPE